MPLGRGEYRGHNFDERVCIFTMMNGENAVRFKIEWPLMDDLERGARTNVDQREEQFNRLRQRIEGMAERKFFSFTDENRPQEFLLTTGDIGI